MKKDVSKRRKRREKKTFVFVDGKAQNIAKVFDKLISISQMLKRTVIQSKCFLEIT